MLKIEIDGLEEKDGFFYAICKCGKQSRFTHKTTAVSLIKRGNCRYCKRDYRSVNDGEYKIYQNNNGKWCSTCSGCGIEQAYSRKEHAKQSSLGDFQCKKCVAQAKGFSKNTPVGDRKRLFNKFRKCAIIRGIEWSITEEQMYRNYTGKCNMTGWDLNTSYLKATASLDRIDNSKGYTEDNIQWVHSRVNLAKNKYPIEEFVSMCKAIASHYTGI